MSELLIQIVDESDKPLRGGTMEEAQRQALWHRIVRVMCVDEDRNLFLQKRAEHEFSYPGCWDTSASGHVDEGEDYLEAALREAQEEIGLVGVELREVYYYKHERSMNEEGRAFLRFIKIYEAQVSRDHEFSINHEEVSSFEKFTPQEVKGLVKNHPASVTDGLEQYVERAMQ